MSGAVVTPELALVDPELADELRQLPERKAAMSSTEPSNGMYFVDQQPEPAPLAPPVSPAPPVEEPAPQPAAAASPPAESGTTPMVDVPLGTLIFRAGLLAEEQLEDALQEGMRSGKRLGEVLLERGWLHERDLGRLLAGQKGLPFVEIAGSDAQPEALAAIPEEKARMQNTLPLRRTDDGGFVVAVADPSNELVIENLRRTLGSEPTLVVAPQSELIRAIDEAYLKFQAQAATMPAPEPQLSEPMPEPVQSLTPEPAQMPTPDPEPAQMPSLQDPMPEPVMTAPATEPAPTPQPDPVPMLQTEPVESLSAPAVTPLPTSLPPAVEREVDQSEPLQPLMTEPVAQVEEALPAPAPEPPAFEESPLAPLQQPVAEPEPSFEPEPPAAAEQPLPPLQPPVAEEPAPAPPVSEEPVMPALAAPEPQPAPEPLAPLAVEPEPLVVEPTPLAPPVPEAAPEPDKPAVINVVVMRLRDGEVLEIGTFSEAAEASSRAQQVVAQITAAEGEATWPFFADRYLRPDTIVSVDLLEEPADKWSGSAIRQRWAAAE